MVRRALVEERAVEFPGSAGVIEGRVANETSDKGALVVLHPHPLYGGRMNWLRDALCFSGGSIVAFIHVRGINTSSCQRVLPD